MLQIDCRIISGLRSLNAYRGKLDSLSSVTGLTDEATATLVRKCPHLLSCNSDTIALKFKGIRELVQRPHEEVRGRDGCVHSPSPWSMGVCTVPALGQCCMDAEHLPAYYLQVVNMILETPQLLFLNTQSLEVKFNELCSVMGMSPGQIGEIASARPMLLTSSTQTLKVNRGV